MKILFVVTAFYPEQAIGSIRVTKFAKYLHAEGHDVTVISLSPMPWSRRDETLRFPGLDQLEWWTIPQGRFFSRFLGSARASMVGGNPANIKVAGDGSLIERVKGKVRASAQMVYSLAKGIDWTIQVRKHAHSHIAGRRFDAIFASYPSFASPFAAIALKSMGLTSNLVVDFRDPISYGEASNFSLARLLERWMLRHADLTSHSSKGVFKKVVGDLPEEHPTALVVTNGFDPDDLERITPSIEIRVDPNCMNFLYVGGLYGGKRDLGALFFAIKQAMDSVPGSEGRLALHYAGDEGAIFTAQARAHHLDRLVQDHGRVSRGTALWLQQQCDVCLLATWNTLEDQGILTGKLFEFFLMRKPVLAVVTGNLGNSEMKQVLDLVGGGFCFEQAQPESMPYLVDWLKARLREKHAKGALAATYNDKVDLYDLRYGVSRLFSRVERRSSVDLL